MKLYNGEERLKNILCGDKNQNPDKIVKIIKSEIFFILKDYFEIEIDDIKVNVLIENNKKLPKQNLTFADLQK